MARVTTLKDRVRQIIRRYKRINKHRFLYNTKRDLAGRYNRIKVYFLIHEQERGYSIFPFEFKRKVQFTVPQWTQLFSKSLKGYDSLYNIFTQAVLPAINNKGGSQWRFKALLGWTGVDDLRQGKDSAKRSARDKTAKKRTANARNPRRRRQRD